MRVRACYYGGLRARLGMDGQWLDLEEGSRASDLVRVACGHLGCNWTTALALAVNDAMADGPTLLKDGDQVALLPPVCGGGPEAGVGLLDRCFLTMGPLELGALLGGLDDPACGALAVFVGRVRREQDGRGVLRLDYEAHGKLALKQLLTTAREARLRWNLGPLILAHRVGELKIGDAAVLVAVTSGHRDTAFAACRFLIDGVKAAVPIWKHEFYVDGGDAWVGAPSPDPPRDAVVLQ